MSIRLEDSVVNADKDIKGLSAMKVRLLLKPRLELLLTNT